MYPGNSLAMIQYLWKPGQQDTWIQYLPKTQATGYNTSEKYTKKTICTKFKAILTTLKIGNYKIIQDIHVYL